MAIPKKRNDHTTACPKVFIKDHVRIWMFYILQVALCFSPVGTKLRVRSRKFPAVVNCTSIDWFHEWPQEALESVSLRFLQEVEHIEVRNTQGWVIGQTPHTLLHRHI